jgi:exodeoxyribonuclease VII small subunit
MSPSLKKVEELTYEAAFTELETIVAALEGESRPLDESISLYERGQALARHCSALLEKAELKVRQLSGDGLVDFETEA